ncbi:ABC transporter substrate-binding protein [Clostridium chromiireducens]|uniref:ABC transporter substrate-binding protein n=1 Tax=Clostridium chromiireducens TaxID=225345 RepID=UPI003AF93B5B
MRKISHKLLISIVIINFTGMILGGTTTKNDSITEIANVSIEKDRLQTIKEKGVITVATPLYDYPFFYINPETKKISGIDAEIINEISKRMGVNKVDMRETVFSNLLEKLNTEDSIDMAAGGIYITPEREEIVTFSEPLYKEAETVVVPRYSKINFMDDLKNSIVGVEKGTVFMELAQNWKENNLVKEVVIFENTSDLLMEINNERIHAGLADGIVVDSLLAKDNKLLLRTLKDYTPKLPGNIGIAVRKNDISIIKELNKIINEMKADGTLYTIIKEYGLDKNNMISNQKCCVSREE